VDWLWEHRQQLIREFGVDRYVNSKGEPLVGSKKKIGALVAYAPGDLAGAYANGDGARTLGLFKQLWPKIQDRGMGEAYDRERELMPILLDNERVGYASTCARCGRTASSTSQPLSRRMLGYVRDLKRKILIWMLMRRSQKLLLELNYQGRGLGAYSNRQTKR
jgi:hypothetical protein